MLYLIPGYIKIHSLKRKDLLQSSSAIYNAVAVLKDNYSKRDFFINEATKLFIEKFTTAKDFITVNKEIATAANVKEDDVKPYTEPFFQHIKKMGFIIKDGSSMPVKSRALFNKNKRLDNYRIEKCLDSTRTIDVYAVREISSQKKVVIKLLKQGGTENFDQFKREYNFLYTLSNSGVTPEVYDIKKEKAYCYFVLEYINGLELKDYLQLHPRLRLQSFIKIAGTLIHSFKIIHDRGIVHGDIHPGNIFITATKQARLIDFGLAINHKLESNEIVKHGGVYFYMPPERINNTTHNKFLKQPDFLSDVFQLGVVLYIMLYDKYPFNGITWEELATEIKEKEPFFPDISVYNFSVPAGLKKLMKKCLSKDPRQRFSNAAQLYKAFQKYFQCL